MLARQALSEFDVLRWHRLPNWGRWGRHDPDKPDPQRVCGSICVKYIPAGEDWDYEAPPESLPPPLNYRDAEELDGYLRQMLERDRKRFQILAKFFYKQQPVAQDRLDEAIRGLMDVMDENRRVVDRMYELLRRG